MYGDAGLEWLDWPLLIGVLAVASMILGNVVAIVQTNIKRLLAYSTIAQAGYILIGVAALRTSEVDTYELALSGVLFYLAAYTLSNLAAFGAIIALTAQNRGDGIENLAGGAARSPFAAIVLTIALISLVGLPPTGLFVGKIYLFYGAVQSGLWWLALAGALNSFVSAYYYLRPIRTLWAGESDPADAASQAEFRPSLSSSSVPGAEHGGSNCPGHRADVAHFPRDGGRFQFDSMTTSGSSSSGFAGQGPCAILQAAADTLDARSLPIAYKTNWR